MNYQQKYFVELRRFENCQFGWTLDFEENLRKIIRYVIFIFNKIVFY